MKTTITLKLVCRFLLLACIITWQSGQKTASASDSFDDQYEILKKIHIDTRSGYRKGSLNWNIAAPNNSPNILSELSYEDLEIYEAGVNAKAVINKFYSRASINFGRIIDGTGIDSDYRESDRNALFSQSESKVSDEINDICIGLGYQMDFFRKKLLIAPLAGLSYHSQKVRQKGGIQTIAAEGDRPAQGRLLSGLNSIYEAKWRTMFVGVDMDFEIMNNLFLLSSVEYHKASYEATADWNLRTDFAHPVSFMHNAIGQGTSLSISVNRIFAKRWLIGLMYGWQDWSTEPGNDTLFWAGGGTSKSQLNEVNWKSQSVNLSIGYNF